jgi:hypothetical protein
MFRIAIVAAALAAAAPAFAQPAGPAPGHRPFLSPAGEPFRGEDGLAAWFAGADANKDGALTLVEFRDDAMRFFKVLDANGDGQVDGPENSAYETKIAPEITRMDMGGPPEKRPMVRKTDKREPRVGAARFSLINEAQPVRGADADLNQRVSSEEWAKAARRRFEILDTDEDGKLTLEALRPRLAR